MYTLTLNHTLSKITPDNFSSCFPTIAATNPSWLRDVRQRFATGFGDACKSDFDKTLGRRGVVGRLNELEGLVGDAARRRGEESEQQQQQNGTGGDVDRGVKSGGKPTPPHLLPASSILAAHMAPQLALQQSTMNAKLQNSTAANLMLYEEIQAQRREVEGILAALEKVVVDLDGSNELMDGVVEELIQEGREVEVEMVDA